MGDVKLHNHSLTPYLAVFHLAIITKIYIILAKARFT